MDIYADLGVRKIINGSATLTMLGGSIMPPEVLEAMADASRHFVRIDELQEKVGQRIAEWTHNEAAYVSSGAAAGLVLSTAACIAGTDPQKREKLPRTEGMNNEIIVHKRGRVGYDFAVRQVGAVLVEIGDEQGATRAQLEAAITPRTAGIFHFYNAHSLPGQVPLEEMIAVAKAHNIPLVIDAAAQLPPVENLWKFTQMGADLVLFSGGKGLSGPQSSGLVLGRKDLIEACAFHACPRPFIGRGMKAGKEEIVGLMTALRIYLDTDHEAVMRTYEEQVASVIEAFRNVPGISARRDFPSEAGQPMPRAELTLDEGALGITRDEVLRRLMEGEPAISLAGAGKNGIYINPQTLRQPEEQIVIARLLEILQPAAH